MILLAYVHSNAPHKKMETFIDTARRNILGPFALNLIVRCIIYVMFAER
jgi:hypothetical protein